MRNCKVKSPESCCTLCRAFIFLQQVGFAVLEVRKAWLSR